MCIIWWCIAWPCKNRATKKKKSVTAPLWSLRVYSEIFSTSRCCKCTQSRHTSNLCWHKVTPDDARISNKIGDWLYRSAKAAPATRWIMGSETHTSLPQWACNTMPISLKLAVIVLIWRSVTYSWLMGQSTFLHFKFIYSLIFRLNKQFLSRNSLIKKICM